MIDKYQSIGLFIDGGYYAKINEALEENMSLNINVSRLISFIKGEIAKIGGCDISDCHITESHYFRGLYRVNDANMKHLLYSERKFEDSLIENDVVFHYKHLREVQKGSNVTVIEKGVDVWFALEAYELATIRKFDFVVLITGDADHEMLVKKLKALKIHTVLLTWDVSDDEATSTAKLLKDEACTHIEINKLISENKERLRSLCRAV
ncbi:NYN domain-containing protein [Bacteroides caecigallinarum]|uniref:NYN domain-containing protein n=1 Tax=Bacteroides caecigallinarum TaxID=1411144 RepID=UPI00195AF842|nr:NYN domain-containing protein [Bacteroides caecigallinarum]MBM6891295.1 NYN domain-containing protein [Bacteroides caecigallinarum]